VSVVRSGNLSSLLVGFLEFPPSGSVSEGTLGMSLYLMVRVVQSQLQPDDQSIPIFQE
jgi:hypothetical protein